jgi:hypothetical protein
VPLAGVPDKVALPLPRSTSVTPAGKAPDSVTAGVGDPVAFTVKEKAVPTWAVLEAAGVIAGPWVTVMTKVWVAFPAALEAVRVRVKTPTKGGVPARVAVPPWLVNVTPAGNVPDRLSVGAGYPVAVTVKVNGVPTAPATDVALVITGACRTVRENDWVALPAVFAALREIGYTPPVPAAGVPERVALPLPRSTSVTPAGKAPDSVMAAVGEPVVLTVKLSGDATVAVVLAALVMVGIWAPVVTRRLKLCVTTPAVEVAVTVRGKVPVSPGVPDKVAVPVPSAKIRPFGSVPVSVMAGDGVPIAENVSVVATLAGTLADTGLVITGATSSGIVTPDVAVTTGSTGAVPDAVALSVIVPAVTSFGVVV